MRILAVADFYCHGASRIIEERAASLAAAGHEVVLLAGADPGKIPLQKQAAALSRLDAELIPWDPGDRGPLRLLALARAFRAAFGKRCAEGRFDAMLFNQPLSAWAVLGSAFSRGVPALYTFHSPWPLEWAIDKGLEVRGARLMGAGLGQRLRFAARRWIEGQAIAGSSHVTLLSPYMRSRLLDLHPTVPSWKITMIPGGVDTTRFHPLDPSLRAERRKWLGIEPDTPLLLTVRRLVPRMGLEALIQAFRTLAREFPDLHLVIGGSGPQEENLRAQAAAAGLEGRIRFLGYVPEGALPGLYAAADLFVLPTAQLEGFGLVTVEALACGTPVLGTPVGATPAILQGIDSRLVARSAGAADLATAAAVILRMPPVALRALGALGRRRILSLYDARKVGASLDALLRSLAEPLVPEDPGAGTLRRRSLDHSRQAVLSRR